SSLGHCDRLLSLRGRGVPHRAFARRPRPQAPSGLRVPRGGTGPQRGRGAALLVAAGLAGARDHALVSLLCLNGLRVSEAIGADVERLALERGHRTLTITRKGAKVVTVPLAPRTARAVDLAVGERCEGPILLGADGTRLDRIDQSCRGSLAKQNPLQSGQSVCVAKEVATLTAKPRVRIVGHGN